MKRSLVIKAFKEAKELAKLDYAWTEGYCCNTCTLNEISMFIGSHSKGIYLKWYRHGGNKRTWKSVQDEQLYIAHEVDEQQMNILLDVLKKYFKVEYDGDTNHTIVIKNKEA